MGCPSSTIFTANIICTALHLCKGEIYHVAHDNYSSRMECATYIAEYFKRDPKQYFEPIENAKFGLAARPSNTCLDAGKLKKLLGVHSLGNWQADVMSYLSTRYNTWSQ